jgi:hypothetical protein
MSETTETATPGRVECPAAKDPAVQRFILAAMLLGFGVWCWTDRAQYPYVPASQDINLFLKHALNNWGPFLLVPAGALLAGWAALQQRRRLVADAEGIGYGEKRMPWSQVTLLDATRLKSKGILKLHHGDKVLVLDSWRLRGFRDLVAFVEQHVPPDVTKV